MSDRHIKKNLDLSGLRVAVHSYTRISVDDILAHKMREVLFYLTTKRKWSASRVHKSIKNSLTEVSLDG